MVEQVLNELKRRKIEHDEGDVRLFVDEQVHDHYIRIVERWICRSIVAREGVWAYLDFVNRTLYGPERA
jgi:hypothetical protein